MGDRSCAWCRAPIPAEVRRDAVHCGQRCRQAAWRFGRGRLAVEQAVQPRRWAYADPPYPGLARRYYRDHPDYAGEVDHRALLTRLAGYDGWALSTSAAALPEVLGLAADLGLEVRVAAWVRGARAGRASGPRSAWEPVVYRGERRVPCSSHDASPAGRADALVLTPRARTTDPQHVVGAKPAGFAWWLFELLGAQVGDELDDLFPGSGGIARAWSLLQASPRAAHDASPRGLPDASSKYSADASRAARPDASPFAKPDASGRSSATGGGGLALPPA